MTVASEHTLAPNIPKNMELVVMKSLISIPSVLLCLCFLMHEGAAAQSRVLTLRQAIETARERNLDIVQSLNNVESAQAGVLAAQGDYLPSLSASASWNRNQTERNRSTTQIIGGEPIVFPSSSSVTNSFSSSVNVGYTIFDGFRREGSMGRATSTAVATEQQAMRVQQAIEFQVARSYVNVLRSEQLVKVSEENLKRGNRQLERITESNRVGASSLADVYRQQSQVARDELDLITARNNFNKAKADLVALIGLDVSVDYEVADPSISSSFTKQEMDANEAKYANFSDLSQRALTTRPDYIGASENLSGAESGVTSARSGYFPTVSAFAGYGLSNTEISRLSENKSINWGVNLRWNLFDGFQTNQSIQSAVATRRNAEISLTQAERNINVEIKKALLDLDAARKAFEVSQKGLTSATEDRKIAEERYNLGAGTLLDLLQANAGLVAAEANLINAAYDYVIAKRNLEFALGELSL